MDAEDKELDIVPVQVEWSVSEDTVTLLTTNLVVQHGPGVFILNFFDMQLPIDPQEDADELPTLVAKCVARVGVPAPSMRSFVQALEDNIARYEARFGPIAEEASVPEDGAEQ